MRGEADRGAGLAVQIHLVEGVSSFLADDVEAHVTAEHRLTARVRSRPARHGSSGRRRLRLVVHALPDADAVMDPPREQEAAQLRAHLAEALGIVVQDERGRRLDDPLAAGGRVAADADARLEDEARVDGEVLDRREANQEVLDDERLPVALVVGEVAGPAPVRVVGLDHEAEHLVGGGGDLDAAAPDIEVEVRALVRRGPVKCDFEARLQEQVDVEVDVVAPRRDLDGRRGMRREQGAEAQGESNALHGFPFASVSEGAERGGSIAAHRSPGRLRLQHGSVTCL